MSRWTILSPESPLADARLAAGLSLGRAAVALGLEDTAGSRSTVASRERGGKLAAIYLLLERCEAYGLEVEIRVRKKSEPSP